MAWTLVTGGARRLGAELCLALAAEGKPVLIHYCASLSEAQQVAAACRRYGVAAELIQGDFSTPASTAEFIERCLKQFPGIKHLINNVGSYLIKPVLETSMEEWLALFQTNLHAPFALSRAFMPALRSLKGNIINIGVAGVGSMHVDNIHPAYRMAKMALWMLTKTLARELAKDQVRVNMVSPGYIDNSVMADDIEKIPMQRAARVSEVARVVSFLLQDDSEYLTGQNIEVGGGVGL